jgi:hypothetical protein
VDLQRAYDSINREKLWDVLVECLDIPTDLVQIIRNMYVQSQGLCFDKKTGEFLKFLANLGVKQGDGASPELFTLFFDRVYPHLLAYYKARNIQGNKRRAYTIASL